MTKTSRKKYKKIFDLVRDTSGDESLAKELQVQISKRQIVRSLARLRNSKSIPQDDVAQILSCKQARISKLENGLDEDLSLRDLAAYAQALNFDLAIVLRSKDLSPIDAIKMHAMGIQKGFDSLNSLVKGNGVIASGVAHFHLEALFNLVEIVSKSATRLADSTKRKNPEPSIALAVEAPDFEGQTALAFEAKAVGSVISN